jgi:hypothetical protein
MKTGKIIRPKRFPKSWDDFGALKSMREYVGKKLGKLDAAASFMYLFLRFGVPDITNKDDDEILYLYDFRYDDLIFSIHASSRDRVYFNFNFAKKHVRNFPCGMPEIDDMPEIKAALDGIIEDLKTGYCVRDVPMNILGYEDENNPIEIYTEDENS